MAKQRKTATKVAPSTPPLPVRRSTRTRQPTKPFREAAPVSSVLAPVPSTALAVKSGRVKKAAPKPKARKPAAKKTKPTTTSTTKPRSTKKSVKASKLVVSASQPKPSTRSTRSTRKRKASTSDVFYDAVESQPKKQKVTEPSEVTIYEDAKMHQGASNIITEAANEINGSKESPCPPPPAPSTLSRKRARSPSDPEPVLHAKKQKFDLINNFGEFLANWDGCWLMKAEPDTKYEKGIDVSYSIDDLMAEKKPAAWSGVRNIGSRNNIQAQKEGTHCFFYHSSCREPGIVGIMEIVQKATPDETAFDPADPYYDSKSCREKPRWFNTHVEFRQKFDHPEKTTLKALRKYTAPGGPLQNMQLFKQTRMPVVRVSKEEWNFILDLAGHEEYKFGPEHFEVEESTTLTQDKLTPPHQTPFVPLPSSSPVVATPVQPVVNKDSSFHLSSSIPKRRFSFESTISVPKSVKSTKSAQASSSVLQSEPAELSSPVRFSPRSLFKVRESPIKKSIVKLAALHNALSPPAPPIAPPPSLPPTININATPTFTFNKEVMNYDFSSPFCPDAESTPYGDRTSLELVGSPVGRVGRTYGGSFNEDTTVESVKAPVGRTYGGSFNEDTTEESIKKDQS